MRLYTPVPRSVIRWYPHEAREGARERLARATAMQLRLVTLEAIIGNKRASERSKRLARLEVVALRMKGVA